eukprot:scaffold2159_cov200-Alexandrium_tamarense.AAC.6
MVIVGADQADQDGSERDRTMLITTTVFGRGVLVNVGGTIHNLLYTTALQLPNQQRRPPFFGASASIFCVVVLN